jgi:zinc transporter ZupT
LPVADPGDYELALQASGQAGEGEARVPVTVAQQPFAWIAALIPAALGAFVLIIGGAMVVRLRRVTSHRINQLLTSSMALCALVALVAVVVTQFIPANVTLSLSGSPTAMVAPTS